MNKVLIKKLENFKNLELPHYATNQSAGVDLAAAIENKIVIAPGEVKIIETGLAMALPAGMEVQIRPRSGLAAKHGITVLNSPGTIDADYRGEVKVILINHGSNEFVVERGMRIAQAVFAKYEQVKFMPVDSLEDTQRGAGGFGSTGV